MKKKLKFYEIDELAKKLANFVKENSVIALIGELGTGKTTFTKTFSKELGVKENLKSPTFNYVLEYLSGRLPLYHFDVYRLCEAEEIYEIGYEDYINNGGVAIIEWANIIETELPKEYIKISFEYSDNGLEDKRIINLEYIGNKIKEGELLDYVNFRN
ncbi:MAG: tRNA (adenosine(37)-N6)-threonylcarbamoyltransferase complex ATPase subunit type 1 TsaE [Fusobacterium sp.]|uniref:tRNA (adenosine(37)-N6)-threonylcarbamoyltransferase complex ATPase subunit type 1 TsaE n=1 Tax=Fusobacterium sp. TaxID=68766 RepID=UPI0026DBF270|nr:tRNA (adenosine(37)-N6)-threonylcarbamoyltransferase complex ATPase subunit type 1 TsaE [Fusobacterium sp.]MDO4690724.1 tRNA (adenosine(37)-N6)-threonylcarbamoyltransferase complex ATPase subunit type 1 TsaE [Fusobacterium sp.]